MNKYSLTPADKKKIALMSIVVVYVVLWIITLWGMAVYTIYGKNPGDTAKFWIEANRLCPWVSLLVCIAIIVMAIILIKSEKRDKKDYTCHPLTK